MSAHEGVRRLYLLARRVALFGSVVGAGLSLGLVGLNYVSHQALQIPLFELIVLVGFPALIGGIL
jgi:hypothetical protein